MQINDTSLLRQQAYVGGRWDDAENGERFAVTNPADGSTITEVAQLGATETRQAIEAANAALPAWRDRTAKGRATVLRRWFVLIIANQEDLARRSAGSRASRSPRAVAKSLLVPASSSGTPRKPSASTAT